jgi:probable rRNA maturation factor
MILVEPDIRGPFGRRLRVKELERFLEAAQRAVQLRGDVSVLLTGDTQIRRWNREYRGKNKPTDVLSFPAAALDGAGPGPLAGDLALSVETAARQAEEHGHRLAEEVRILVLHGLLHLAGYDHETDDGEMARKELRLRAKLNLSTGLIERAGENPQSATGKSARRKAATRKPGSAVAPRKAAPPARKSAAGKPKPATRKPAARATKSKLR